MCPNRVWFSNYTKINGGKMFMGNNMSYNVIGVGYVSIRLRSGVVKTLGNVRHVADLQRNLISLGTLDE